MFGSFLHDDFVENNLDMGLGCYVRFGLWVVAEIGKFGCGCSWCGLKLWSKLVGGGVMNWL